MVGNSKFRWIANDNADLTRRTGTWFQQTRDSFNNFGNNGPILGMDQVGTNGTASFVFNFTGSAVTIMGTSDVKTDSESGAVEPTWQCSVQGDIGTITIPKPAPSPENNWPLCIWDWGENHGDVVMSVNVTSNGQFFWVDQVRINDFDSIQHNPLVFVNFTDPGIEADSNWSLFQDVAILTSKTDATVSFKFTGTQVTWYGITPEGFPSVPSSALYSVDGQANSTVSLKGTSGLPTLFNQPFFSTDVLTADSHELTVVYQGNGQSTPLTLSYLLVQDGDVHIPPPSSSSSPTNPTASSTLLTGPTSTPNPSKQSVPIGAIIGGILGGLAVLVAALFALLFCHRRRRRKSIAIRTEAQMNALYSAPPPSIRPDLQQPSNFKIGATSFPRHLPMRKSPGHRISTIKTPPQPQPTSETQQSNSTPASSLPSQGTSSSTSRSRFVTMVHEDSGIRLPPPPIPRNQGEAPLRALPASKTIVGSQSNPTGSENPDNIAPSTSGSHLTASAIPRIARVGHEDSGVQLPPPPHHPPLEDNPIEIPPAYSP